MNVKDTVTRALLLYPMIYPNKLAVYNHFFCVIGNGYDWKKGQLFPSETKRISKLVPPTIKEAILIRLGEELEEDWERYVDFQEKFNQGELDESLPHFLAQLKEDIQRILNFEDRFNDISIPQKQDLISKQGFTFYPLCRYSAMCCIPDDIRQDWLEAIEETVKVMKDNLNLVEDPEGWLPKVESRIQNIKNKNGWN